MTTFYKVLSVKKTDSKEKIKKAYRKKSMKTHPDQGGTSQEFDRLENYIDMLFLIFAIMIIALAFCIVLCQCK